jgi:hypothetical protein
MSLKKGVRPVKTLSEEEETRLARIAIKHLVERNKAERRASARVRKTGHD